LCVGAVTLVALPFAAVSAGSERASPRAKPAPGIIKLRVPAPGHVNAAVLTFTRKAGSTAPPRIALAGRYTVRPRVTLVGGVSRWANSETQWVALVTIVNFKPQPPSTGRTLAAVTRPLVRIRAQRPYKTVFVGNVPVDRAMKRPIVINSFGLGVVLKRISRVGIPDPYDNPAYVLNEVRRALAGLPNPAFAAAVLGRLPTSG
jgi:hypothetical protein